MLKSPCRYCEKRFVGCRNSCDAWLEYEAAKKVEYEQRRFDSNVLSNPVKSEAITNYQRWKLNRQEDF